MIEPDRTDEHGAGFWIACATGIALMAWGIFLFLDATPDAERRVSFVTWVVGLDLLHDLLVAPAVCAAGALAARVLPRSVRAPVQAGLLISALVLVIAVLPLAGTAAGARNPSIQPLDYTTATLTVLAAVWAGVTAWAVGSRLRARSRSGARWGP